MLKCFSGLRVSKIFNSQDENKSNLPVSDIFKHNFLTLLVLASNHLWNWTFSYVHRKQCVEKSDNILYFSPNSLVFVSRCHSTSSTIQSKLLNAKRRHEIFCISRLLSSVVSMTKRMWKLTECFDFRGFLKSMSCKAFVFAGREMVERSFWKYELNYIHSKLFPMTGNIMLDFESGEYTSVLL